MGYIRPYRVALWSAILISGGSIGLTYAVAAVAHTVASPATMVMASPATMVMASPTTISSSVGTMVRLHQRLVRVTIHNFAFSPARLVVSPGARIVWTNQDSDPHTVDSTKNLWASEALDTGNQFARVFKTAGAFSYYCSIHPYMHGTIIVKK
jgi:plastocyanin